MDIFIEQLLKRRRTTADYVKIALCVVGMLALIYFITQWGFVPFIGMTVLIVCGLLLWLLIWAVQSTNAEFEYTFTNGVLDVDKILNKRTRKKVLELNSREIQIMAKQSSSEYRSYERNSAVKKIFACADAKNPNDENWFVVYIDGSQPTMLIFTPEERIVDGFHKYNPQKVNM